MRGLGGDQINMGLSSWALLYRYTGNPEVPDASCAWPHLPHPYNTGIHPGI